MRKKEDAVPVGVTGFIESCFLYGKWQDDWVFGLLKTDLRQKSPF